jgi:hypothetical protein
MLYIHSLSHRQLLLNILKILLTVTLFTYRSSGNEPCMGNTAQMDIAVLDKLCILIFYDITVYYNFFVYYYCSFHYLYVSNYVSTYFTYITVIYL